MLSSPSHSTAAASQEEGEGGGQEGCLQPSLPALSPLSRALSSAARGVSKAKGRGNNYGTYLPKDPDASQVLLLCPMGCQWAKAVVLPEVRSTLSCNQAGTVRPGSRRSCGLASKGQHDPCQPVLIAMLLGSLRPSLAHLTPVGLLWRRANSNHKYSVSNTEPSSGAPQISTIQPIPAHPPVGRQMWKQTYDCSESGENKF